MDPCFAAQVNISCRVPCAQDPLDQKLPPANKTLPQPERCESLHTPGRSPSHTDSVHWPRSLGPHKSHTPTVKIQTPCACVRAHSTPVTGDGFHPVPQNTATCALQLCSLARYSRSPHLRSSREAALPVKRGCQPQSRAWVLIWVCGFVSTLNTHLGSQYPSPFKWGKPSIKINDFWCLEYVKSELFFLIQMLNLGGSRSLDRDIEPVGNHFRNKRQLEMKVCLQRVFQPLWGGRRLREVKGEGKANN